jgi:hypothetical protein
MRNVSHKTHVLIYHYLGCGLVPAEDFRANPVRMENLLTGSTAIYTKTARIDVSNLTQ